MNRERAKELLPIIQAYAEGKEIECAPEDGYEWFPCPCPAWSITNKYRIKQEPKTGWINIYRDIDEVSLYPSRQYADDVAHPSRIACIQITYYEGEGL